jgi:uncharacterized membrane protein
MKITSRQIEPSRVAGVFLCSAAFAGGVANHSGPMRGLVAGVFIFCIASLGLFLPRLTYHLVGCCKTNPKDRK